MWTPVAELPECYCRVARSPTDSLWYSFCHRESQRTFCLVSQRWPSLVFMFQPQGGGQGSMRLPPRWEPNMENTLPFRSWMQDLMLWTICTDMNAPQQCAAIISQLGGAARELARSLTPNEVFNGGQINGVMLDPVSYLLHGLQQRFAPLDEENRLRAAQDLLSFTRRRNETVDTLLSRFEITRQRAQAEGGGHMPVETAALLLLRACGVSAEQFQTLTQPFGLRLPRTEAELAQMSHHLRRLGHTVERYPNNIASGLRTHSGAHYSQAFLADSGAASEHVREEVSWSSSHDPSQVTWDSTAGAQQDWAFASLPAEPGQSDTDSATSSDDEAAVFVSDLQGMTPQEADEFLFGQYQEAKKRWRRFTGKPVRALRRIVRRKGKGKGKSKSSSYLSLDDMLQASAYFKGKGKGGRSSGKGFGRRQNPKGRDSEPLKCSICGSAFHLRARCPRRDSSNPAPVSSSQPASSTQPPAFTVQPAGLHFATFEASDGSWSQIPTPRSIASSWRVEGPHTQALRQCIPASATCRRTSAQRASCRHRTKVPVDTAPLDRES